MALCTCIICGCAFKRRNPKGRPPIACYDPECQKALRERQAELNNIRGKRRYRARNGESLQEVSAKANDCGMTYGQYVLMTERVKNDGQRKRKANRRYAERRKARMRTNKARKSQIRRCIEGDVSIWADRRVKGFGNASNYHSV